VAARNPLPEQRRFIERDPSQHALLAAGPGTGKTFTIEGRAEFLVEQAHVDPDRIAVLSLTRTLVESLAERMPYGRAQTFHSFALTWLNRLGDAWERRVVAPEDVDDLVRLDLQQGVQLAFDVTTPRNRIGKFIERLSAAFRDDQQEPAHMTPEERQLFQVFQHQRELFRYRLMDELAYDLLRLIEQGAEVEDPPTHILCDEYQDFTAGELRLMELFATHLGTVVNACGDDRQSIYRFRAADPLALHRFPAAYGIGEVDYLWRSSRCPQAVCDLANRIAEALPQLDGIDRPALEPWEGREDAGTVEVVVASTPAVEARWIVRGCAEFVAVGVVPAQIIVVAAGYADDVVRNLQAAAVEFAGAGISFFDPRVRSTLSEDRGVRLLSAGARLLASSDDQMAWRRLVAETPGLGASRLKRILAAGEATYVRCLRAIAESDALCARPLTAGDALIAAFGAEDEVSGVAIVELLAENLGIEGLDLGVVTTLAGDTPTAPAAKWFERIIEGSDDTELMPGALGDAIPVYTVFGAKGLQAPVVFLANALTPAFVARGEAADGIRRAYVGITRAQSHLLISAPMSLQGSTLAHKVDAGVAGLADMIATPVAQLQIEIQRVYADDVRD
jgi:DNA helicase-2/ATP-dependent DNA helicase PcrA